MLRRLRHGERHRYLVTLPAVGTLHCIQPYLSVRRSVGVGLHAHGIAPISADRSGPHRDHTMLRAVWSTAPGGPAAAVHRIGRISSA